MTTKNPTEDDLFVDVRNQYFMVLESCASILPRDGTANSVHDNIIWESQN